MKNRTIEFLFDNSKNHPKSLTESILNVRNLSAGFCRSWSTQRMQDAISTSEQAFAELDHLQNELLRHRDERKSSPSWSFDLLNIALEVKIGELISPANQLDVDTFKALPIGQGNLPQSTNTKKLTLVAALNKLKHRNPEDINFSISDNGRHILYFFYKGRNEPTRHDFLLRYRQAL